MLEDIVPGTDSSGPEDFTAFQGQIYFRAADPVHGYELWRTDGATNGTNLFKDLEPAGHGSPVDFVVFENQLFFRGRSGEGNNYGDQSLWKSNGTSAGTIKLKSFLYDNWYFFPGRKFGAFDGRLYFIAAEALGANSGLWASDGTGLGTQLVKEFGNGYDYMKLSTPFQVGEALYFLHDLGVGHELYVTDGTEAGTQLVTSFDTHLGELQPIGSTLYFLLAGGPGTQLWGSDMTEAGTYTTTHHSVLSYIPFNNTLVYLGWDGAACGLWYTDGSPASVTLLKAGLGCNPDQAHFTAAGSNLFFGASGGAEGIELWKTDGTPEGTGLVKDIDPPLLTSTGSHPRDFVAVGNDVYFTADDGVHGRELWVSDGTEAGTRLVMDINPNPTGWEPGGMTLIGDTLYFSAEDGVHGRELWVLQPALTEVVYLPLVRRR